MSHEKFDQWLGEKARGLPQEFEPTENLWPVIEQRLTRRGERSEHTPRGLYAVAASATLVALAALFVSVMPRAPSTDPAATPTGPVLETNSWLPGVVRVRNEMLTDFESNLDELSPKTRELVEANMKQIHDSLAKIHSALAEDPGNAMLHRLLMNAYQEELSLVSDIAKMKSTSIEL